MTKRNGNTYSAEVRERAVRMVLEHRGEYASEWEAINSIASKIGCTGETLRGWVRRAERGAGIWPGQTSAELTRIKELEREVRELRPSHEMLRKASTCFVKTELDRPPKRSSPSSTLTGMRTGSSRSGVCCRSP